MANEVACPVCQKKYTVGPEMAGRKVRCRQCANVFTVAGAHVPAMAGPPPEQPEDNTTPPVPPPPSLLDSQSQFEQALNRDIQQPKLRPSTRFKFPWAAQLDDWLPAALVAVGVLWSIKDTLRSDIGPVWAKLLRLVVIFGLYAGVVVPITMIAVRKMAMKLGYALPPKPTWRTAATFILPAMLGYLTWVALVSPLSFAIGCLLGLIFAAAAFWFLFRVDPQKELLPSFGAATGSFIGSLVCCGIIMWVLNMVLFGVMKSNHTADTVKISPIGPSFAWNVETPIPQRRGSASGSDSDSSDPDNRQLSQPLVSRPNLTSSPTASLPPIANNSTVAPNNSSSQQPTQSEPIAVTPASEKIGPSKASPTTMPAPPTTPDKKPDTSSKTVFDGINDDTPSTPRAVTPDPVVTSSDTKFVADVKSKQLPFVQDVRSPKDLDGFDELVYPATTSSYVAVVIHKDQSQDAVELRNSTTFERLAIVLFPREGTNDVGLRRYALSPDGQYMARPASFPRPMFQVWSFKEQRVVGRSYLGDDNSTPLLLGFIDNEHFLTQCLVHSVNQLQVREARTGLVVHSTQLPPYLRSPGNGQISPDGKMFALATRLNGQAQVLLFDPMHPTMKSRSCPVRGLSEKFAVEPTGIAFSQDSSRLAAMFASQGEAYVVAWNRDGSVITDQVCPGVAPPQQDSSDPCGGHVFDWVGNNAWLVGGQSFVDPLSGKIMANLASSAVKAQRCVDRDTWQFEYPTGQGKDRLAVVQLDLLKLAQYAKRNSGQ